MIKEINQCVSPAGTGRATSVGVFAAIVALAAAIRLIDIGVAPLWTDELFSANYPKLGLSFLWSAGVRIEPTPPAYYSLIAAIEHLAGDGAIWLRLPSAAGSLGTIALTWTLAVELSGRRWAAPLAALFLAVSPESVFYAQEARTYALQSAAVALALLGFAKFLRLHDRWYPLGLYGLGALISVYLHPTSAFAVAAINGAAALAALGPKRLIAGRRLLAWAGTNVAIALLCLPLVSAWLSPNIGAAVDWIPRIDRWTLETIVGTFLAGHGVEDQTKLIAELAVPALAVLLLLSRWRPDRRTVLVVVVAPLLFLGAMILVSLKRPVLLDRTILWLWVPLAVVLGDALAGRLKGAALVVVAALAAGLVVQQSRPEQLKEDWRFLAELPKLPASTLIVLGPYTPPAAIARYAPQLASPVQFDDGRPPVAETIVSQRVFHVPKITADDLRGAIASGRPVCLIYRRPEQGWAIETTASLAPSLALQDRPGPHPGVRALVWLP